MAVSSHGTAACRDRSRNRAVRVRLRPPLVCAAQRYRDGLLTPVQRETFCPYKGICSDYDAGETHRAAWAYLQPYREVNRIDGYVSFEPDKVEVTIDGQRLEPEPGQHVVAMGAIGVWPPMKPEQRRSLSRCGRSVPQHDVSRTHRPRPRHVASQHSGTQARGYCRRCRRSVPPHCARGIQASPKASRSERRMWSTTPAPRASCAAAAERHRRSSNEPDAEQPHVTGVQPYHDDASAVGDAVAVGRLISVNVGRPRDIQWEGRTVRTAVWKRPVTGPVNVRHGNVDGDEQADKVGHGGEHRAVFVYQLTPTILGGTSRTQRLHVSPIRRELPVDGLSDDKVCIGDRYRIGEAVSRSRNLGSRAFVSESG